MDQTELIEAIKKLTKEIEKNNSSIIVAHEETVVKRDVFYFVKRYIQEILEAMMGLLAVMFILKREFILYEFLKIAMPPEAVKVEKTLRSIGLGSQVDEAILSMNRGAEEACKEAAALFIESVKSMNVMDAVSILKGSDSAATQYLRQTTATSLNIKFRPVIENSLKKVDATKHWASLINAYNKVSLKKINPDLTGYVTEKAINGIFYQIAEEEKSIRRDPLARSTELLKKVFGNVSKTMLLP
jgi:hypothetical protein